MNVLFLSQRVPYPPDRGDRITTWHILRHMQAKGDRIRIGALSEDDADAASIAHLEGLGMEVCAPRISRGMAKWTSLRGLATGEALTLPFFRNGALQRQVDRWIAESPPDLIYIYSSSMGQYAMGDAAARARRVMHFAELDSDKWAQFARRSGALGRWIYGREARRLLAFEARVARAFDRSVVVSEVERELFREKIPDVDPVVIPNGVDVDHFASRGDEARQPHTLVFTGVMDYEPNVDGVLWFVDEAWPAVRARHGDARLLVVGSRPCPQIQALHGRDGIEITGRVEAIPPWLDKAAVAIAPLRLARGVQNKVLEAMSNGLPVVSSPQAAQGLGAVDPGTLVVADTMPEFRDEVLRLLGDPEAARAMGTNAARWIRDTFRWENAHAKVDSMLAELGLS